MQNLKIYNTLSRQKEVFESIIPNHVGMYVCGPTVYNFVHLGNVRTFLTFDILYRYLLQIGYKVRYVRNITDVGHLVGDGDEGEDKIGKMAKLEQLEPMEIVQRYTNDFHQVLNLFNFLPQFKNEMIVNDIKTPECGLLKILQFMVIYFRLKT